MGEKIQAVMGRRIRRKRMMLGMMQIELAEKIGMPQEHISRLERGQFVAINPEKLVAIAETLKTSTDFLLGLSDDPGEVEPVGALVGMES
jgi:transcriptional regulator with XRE-family HTH domain